MKLARVLHAGSARWAVLRGEEWHLLPDTEAPELEGAVSAALPDADITFLAPVRPSKILGVGRNFAAHNREMAYDEAANPAIFMKPPNTVVGPGGVVVLPPPDISSWVEHEAEVAVVIGRRARFLARHEVAGAVLGLTCANDVSARDVQRADPLPTRGKGFDTFCPLGPWIETDCDLEEPREIRSEINGTVHQAGSTAEMIRDIPTLVSHISQFTTLFPGDVILTGTPAGCTRLAPGDTVLIEIGGVGRLEHTVAGHSGPVAREAEMRGGVA